MFDSLISGTVVYFSPFSVSPLFSSIQFVGTSWISSLLLKKVPFDPLVYGAGAIGCFGGFYAYGVPGASLGGVIFSEGAKYISKKESE